MKRAAAAGAISERELGRATLARQMLLARERVPVTQAVEKLFGLQAQQARPPYLALWSRLEGFTRDWLTRAVETRKVVRTTMMRATLHLMSAKDHQRFRPALQPAFDAGLRSVLKGRQIRPEDLPAAVKLASKILEERPRTFDELRDELGERFPASDVRALAYHVRLNLPLVQIPQPGHAWGFDAAADFTPSSAWLGPTKVKPADLPELVRRYLAAFGPATAADARSWSALPDLRPVFEAMRDELVVLRDERGRELFDLRDAPRPPADTPAPARLLPDYDSVILAHADRSRIVDDAHRSKIVTANLRVLPMLLVDGRVVGSWKIESKKTATLTLLPFGKLAAKERHELLAEAEQMLHFVEPDAAAHSIKVG